MQQKTYPVSTTVVAVIVAIVAGLIGGYLFGTGAFTEENQAPNVTVLVHETERGHRINVSTFDLDGSVDDLVIKWKDPIGTAVSLESSQVDDQILSASFSVSQILSDDVSEVTFTVIDGEGAATVFTVRPIANISVISLGGK